MGGNGGTGTGTGGGGGGGGSGAVLEAAGTFTGTDLWIEGGNGGRGGYGDRGGGGGGGGGHGLVARQAGFELELAGTTILGGEGGDGGGGSFSRGSAGGGGDGIVAISTDEVRSRIVLDSTRIEGGGGGAGSSVTHFAGAGGSGGRGVLVDGSGLVLENGGFVRGGAGGAGGDSRDRAGGDGGVGGAGISLSGDGSRLVNTGSIYGGRGGRAGNQTSGTPGVDGQGGRGVFIAGHDNVLVNAGTISGGWTGHVNPADQVQNLAVEIVGDRNTLELREGFEFLGDVLARGADNVLALGETSSRTWLDPSSSVIEGFEILEVVGGGDWTLDSIDGFRDVQLREGELLVLDLDFGMAGGATLVVHEGARLGSNDFMLGHAPGLTGEAMVAGRLEALGDLIVGGQAEGRLIIADGTVTSLFAGIGAQADGEVRVEGSNAFWEVDSELIIGGDGNGRLIIGDGGRVESVSGHVAEGIGTGLPGSGEVMVTGQGSRWTTHNIVRVGGTGQGQMTLADGGEVHAQVSVVLADEPGSSGTLNIGAASGEAAQAAGRLDTDTLVFGEGEAKLVFNHSDSDYTFSARLQQGGIDPSLSTIVHENGITTYDGIFSDFAGTTTVSGGTLLVNSALGGSFMVESGGTLGGTGTLGAGGGLAVRIADGGILAPGNSIGTLTVDGDLSLASGAVYRVELNDGGAVEGVNSDYLHVTGTATLADGAIVRLTPENGRDDGSTYSVGTTYSILTADRGLVLEGEVVLENDFAYLDFTFAPEGNGLTALSRLATRPADPDGSRTPIESFCLTGMSTNQCSVGDAAFALGAGHEPHDQMLGVIGGQEGDALDAISGEIHASNQHVIDQTFSLFSNTLRRQGAAGPGGATYGGVIAPLGYMALPGSFDWELDAQPMGAQAWLAPMGSRGTVEGDGNGAQLDWWAAGLAGGYEGVLEVERGEAFAGLGLGYMRSRGSVEARQSQADAHSLQLGLYGGWSDGPLSLAGTLAYGATHTEITRGIGFGRIEREAEAGYWTHSLGVSGEAAYEIALGEATTLSPLVTLDAGWSRHGGFVERGAGGFNLAADGQGHARFDGGLGLALSHTINTETGPVTLAGRAVWERAFADIAPSRTLSFAGTAEDFVVQGPQASRDRLRLGAGLSWEISDAMKLQADYEGLFSGPQQAHGGRIGLSVTF